MINIINLAVEFGGIRPIHNLTVDLTDRIVGVVGPNGAGKTTLLNVFSGFVMPVSGSVTAFGQDLLAMPAHRRAQWGLRRTFQTEQVVEDLSVWDNVAVMLDTVRLSRQERREQVQLALDLVGLTGSEARFGQDLNAYERRRVEIARAMVGQPRLILMDEPGAGLSPAESAELQAIIKGIPNAYGAMVVLIDHDVSLIAATCTSTAVLDFGSLITYGPTEMVLRDERVKAPIWGRRQYYDHQGDRNSRPDCEPGRASCCP
jgi:ABC-type branched-subunit amino acid transport system ATPase component